MPSAAQTTKWRPVTRFLPVHRAGEDVDELIAGVAGARAELSEHRVLD